MPKETRMVRARLVAVALAIHSPLLSQTPATVQRTPVSAPISEVRYEVTFTRSTAGDRRMHVVMTFNAEGNDPILLSLPAWTPGSYEIDNFARWLIGFSATAGQRPLQWDKLDYDTWRIRRDVISTGARGEPVTVTFDYRADTLDNAMSWARPDFLLFNGTNVFMYPEGRPLSFPARVTVRTEPDWKVTTSMPRALDAAAGA